VIGGAVRRYMIEGGDEKKLPRQLRVLAPVNVREEHEHGQLGNRISFLPLEVPLHLEDPVERLQAVHLYTREMKEARVGDSIAIMFELIMGSPAPLYAAGLGVAVTPMMQSFMGMFSAIPPANMIVTNVPGPQIPLYTVGHRMLSFYPTLPVAVEMGVNFAITSYDQKLYMVISGDAAADDAVDAIADHIETCFHELREAAAVKEAAYVKIVREAELHAQLADAEANAGDTPRVVSKAPKPVAKPRVPSKKKAASKKVIAKKAPAKKAPASGNGAAPVRKKVVLRKRAAAKKSGGN